jgi:hypothetical protein
MSAMDSRVLPIYMPRFIMGCVSAVRQFHPSILNKRPATVTPSMSSPQSVALVSPKWGLDKHTYH